jgi:phosphoribosylformylglycinamidine cyclo-ligase
LIRPTSIYVKNLLDLSSEYQVNANAHITGGGQVENIPSVLPAGLTARIDLGSWQPAPVFDWLQQSGKVEQHEMLRTFNCGVGMILAIDAELEQPILQKLQALGEDAWVIGDVVEAAGQAAVVFE